MNGQHFLIYTTEGGGYFKSPTDLKGQVIRFTKEEFDSLRKTGTLTLNRYGDYEEEIIRPVFIALARIEDNHDFILGRSRDATAA